VSKKAEPIPKIKYVDRSRFYCSEASAKKDMKRAVRRARRRAERRDLEDAPRVLKAFTWGWYD